MIGQEPEPNSNGLKLLAFFLAVFGLGLLLSRVLDLSPPTTVPDDPGVTEVGAATFGLAEDAQVVLWFWAPW